MKKIILISLILISCAEEINLPIVEEACPYTGEISCRAEYYISTEGEILPEEYFFIVNLDEGICSERNDGVFIIFAAEEYENHLTITTSGEAQLTIWENNSPLGYYERTTCEGF